MREVRSVLLIVGSLVGLGVLVVDGMPSVGFLVLFSAVLVF